MKSLLQTKEWAILRQGFGWQAHWVEGILVLERKLPFGLSFLYAPEVDFFQLDFGKFLPKIKEIARESRSVFLRLDFLNHKNKLFSLKIEKILKDFGFIKSFEEIQPEYRQIVKIHTPEEEILAQMKQKGRYNINVARRHGVTVEKSENIDEFYQIFCETAERDGFQIRSKKYFEDLLKILKNAGVAELLISRYNRSADKTINNSDHGSQSRNFSDEKYGTPVAAGIFTFYDDTATYIYGASKSEYRNVMAPYLMHWEAIREAKEKGCRFYDLLAISPFGEKVNKKLVAKYEGITRFKEQFGGSSYQTIGSWDLVLKPVYYQLFKWIEKLRRN